MVNIAVVTPIYNTEEYLHRCINSILNQKGVSLEYFLIDDGSTDNSASICQYYQERDTRVTFIKKSNGGQASARNIAIKLANAEFIYFVDSDDYISENSLFDLYDFATKNKLDICSPSVLDYYFDKPLEFISCLASKSQFIRLNIIKENNLLQPLIRSGQDGIFSHLVLCHCTRIGMYRKANYYVTHGREGSTFTTHLERHDLIPKLVNQHIATLENYYDLKGLWHTNSLRLLRFISDETLKNRISPHIKKMGQKEKLICFEVLSKIAKKAAKFVTHSERKWLTSTVNSLIEDFPEKALESYEAEFDKRKNEKAKNPEKNNNINNKTAIISKFIENNRQLKNIDKEKNKSQPIERKPSQEKELEEIKKNLKSLSKKIDFSINTTNNSTFQIISNTNNSYKKLSGTIPNLVVSLTTLPHRISLINLTLESIFNQTYVPEKVVLYITDKIDEKTLSNPKIKTFIERGLTIKKVPDVGPHTKLLYALKDYPNKNIITLDDDIIYPINTIQALWTQHEKFDSCIISNWAREISFDSNGVVEGVRSGRLLTPPRLENQIEQPTKYTASPNILAFPYGTSGVLYPPNSLDNEVYNLELIKKLCPKEDDIWFKAMGLLKNTPVVVTNLGINPEHHCLTGSQDEALRHDNHGLNLNKKQMENVFNHYNLYEKIKSQYLAKTNKALDKL
tara:strand:+ start:2023 stop:4062 length:2040 start_codon:yes stop_codon:yes gene_type:complete